MPGQRFRQFVIAMAACLAVAPASAQEPPAATPEQRAAVDAFLGCVTTSARRFATSRETAPVVARSAVTNCAAQQRRLSDSLAPLSLNLREEIERLFRQEAIAAAELEVVRARSR